MAVRKLSQALGLMAINIGQGVRTSGVRTEHKITYIYTMYFVSVISGFRRRVHEIFTLLGCYAA